MVCRGVYCCGRTQDTVHSHDYCGSILCKLDPKSMASVTAAHLNTRPSGSIAAMAPATLLGRMLRVMMRMMVFTSSSTEAAAAVSRVLQVHAEADAGCSSSAVGLEWV